MASELLKPPNGDNTAVDINVILFKWEHYLLLEYSPETVKV